MGKVKEQLLEFEENDWIKEEQEKILNDTHRWSSITYADILNIDDVEQCRQVKLHTIDGKVHLMNKDDIVEIHGLSIKYRYGDDYAKILRVIPLDKVVCVEYVL